MSKVFDYIAHGGNDVARAEAETEYTAAMLGSVIDENEELRAEIKRLRHGVREISRFLDERRHGDASFVCAALLIDEQSTK